MKLLVALLSMTLLCTNIQAQNDAEKEYFDLLMMYLDGDYEKLFKKADKYMDNDKTRKDPLPYLYAAMGYYEVRNNEDLAPEYPNALKESLKLATKFKRYDRKNEYGEEGDEFLAKLRTEIKGEALNQFNEGKESKAVYYLKQLLRLDEQDYSVTYFQMYLAASEGDIYTTNELRGTFGQQIAQVQDWSKEPNDKRNFLRQAMLLHAKYQKEKGRSDAAIKTIKELESYVGPSEETTNMLKTLKP